MAKKKLNVVNKVMDTSVTYCTCVFKDKNNPKHKGVDLIPKSTSETPYIFAWDDGEVIACNNFSGTGKYGDIRDCGTYVAIRHKDGSITRYQHLKYNSLRVKKGSVVKKNQIIAVYGRPSNGNTTGSHLHWDISFPTKVNNNYIYDTFFGEGRYYVDPVPYLDGSYNQPKLYKVLRDVNIRDNPTLSGSKVVGEYKKGEIVTALEFKSSWIRTEKGWSNNNNDYYFKRTK